ncbi:MAG: ATP-dependent DNA helicase, partial [Pseudomonadales bacterium]|nr:ATP-dependent DNA helicase [Pseudomonadales bacterium]
NAGVAELTFPYGEFRPGQRDMAVSVYRAFTSSQQLVLQAPTGIGKTMASIFPAVRAFTEGRLEKIFYLTAKSSGQEMARAAVSDLRAKQLPLRDVTLTARDKICFNPGAPCDPEHCEYARGYYDKMPGILNDALLQSQALTREAIESLAREHTVCPFELGLDLAVIADVVICDYNYVFDPAVYLRRFFETADDRHGLLIDEAHNLVDRGRDMFSASLQKSMFLDLRREIRTEWPLLGKQLAAVNREILALARAPQLPVDADEERSAVKPADSSGNGNRGRLQERVQDSLPDKLLNALRRLCEAFDLAFQSADHAVRHEGMLRCWFDCLRFLRVSEYFDEHYRCLITPGAAGVEGQASRSRAGDCRVQLCNINPGPLLAKAFERAGPSVCFSATMAPQHYYRTLLGVRDTAPWYGIGSPFDPDHLGVFITTFISTTYRNRNASLYDLVDLIHTIVSAQQGNYLVFAPSYAYLNEVAGKFRERYGHISVLQQTPGLTEEEQQAFTAAFREDATETLVGFAVMGGLFGEGIDLKGRRLIGVVIIGVGMPQPAAERELIREYFDQRDDQGSGFDFAYVLPGMNRVLQTAGRVIRGDDDRGIVCL